MTIKLSPSQEAEWDFRVEGSNSNPYPEGSEDWQQYEQHFDTLCMEEEKFISLIGTGLPTV